MTDNDGSRVLTVLDVSRLLSIGRRAAYQAIRNGQIPGVLRIGRSIRVSRAVFDSWLQNGLQEGLLETIDDDSA
jgi:excisionase family DNA binding protein